MIYRYIVRSPQISKNSFWEEIRGNLPPKRWKISTHINITVDGYAIYLPLLFSLVHLFVFCQQLHQHFEPYLFWNSD